MRVKVTGLKKTIKHLVMFSGGLCSWLTAKRVVKRNGPQDVALLFADTKMEDEDLYRFLDEAAANVGAPLIKIADGRTPWGVMEAENLIANYRRDPCSRTLKRELLDRWRDAHCTPEDTTVYIGLNWDEEHRLKRVQARCKPWRYEAPLMEAPFADKHQMMELLKREGITVPRLYTMGFPHNNCGGFCVKAGQAHFAHLLKTMPERYAMHEAQEEAMRFQVGNHSIMCDRSGGKARPLTMKELRERVEKQQVVDLLEWGGCGCAIE
jgi:hypothetical protein